MKKIRCAIYTRKSAEEGLEQEFNSLDTQREACAAYVGSHKAEGWVLLPTVYEDAGISGGTLERPVRESARARSSTWPQSCFRCGRSSTVWSSIPWRSADASHAAARARQAPRFAQPFQVFRLGESSAAAARNVRLGPIPR